MADPLDPFTKEIKKISKKRAKTEADFEEMARLEFLGSLYLENGVPIIPRTVFKGAMREAAKRFKRGKDIVKGIRIQKNFPLIYNGSKNPEEMWKDEKFRFSTAVVIQKNRIMRMRPIFHEWAAEIEFYYDETIFDKDEIKQILEECGSSAYLMEWRGEYGGFELEL